MHETQTHPSSSSDSSSYGYDSVYEESTQRNLDLSSSSGSSDSYDYGSVHEASSQRFLSLTQSGRSTWDDQSLYDESDPTILDQAQGTPLYRDQDSPNNRSPSLPSSPCDVDLHHSPGQAQVTVDKSYVLPSGRSTPDDVSLCGENDQVIFSQARRRLQYRNQEIMIQHSPTPPLSPHPSSSSASGGTDLYHLPERAQVDQSSPVPAPPPLLSAYNMTQMDPNVWSTILLDLPSLKNKAWISSLLMDAWLSDLQRMRYQGGIRLIPNRFVQNAQLHQDPVQLPREIRRFRSLFEDLPQSQAVSCPLEDCMCILDCGGQHFCTLVFQPQARRVHVLGKKYYLDQRTKDPNLNSWGGWKVPWGKICHLYGWSTDDLPGMTVHSVDWVQNGYDCGPTACQVVKRIWIKGLRLDGEGLWKLPQLPCCHALRLNMAVRVHELAVEGYENFIASKTIYQAQLEEFLEIKPIDTFYQTLEDETGKKLAEHPRYALKDVDLDLRRAMIGCNQCDKGDVTNTHGGKSAPVEEPEVNSQFELHGFGARSSALLRGTRKKQIFVTDTDTEDDTRVEDALKGLHAEGEEEDGQNIPPASALHVDWKQARIGRYPRPKSGPQLPPAPSLRGLRHKFSDDYDDYTNGPSLYVLDPIPDAVMQLAQLSLVYILTKVITTPWILFKDYGYRLLADFMQIFWLLKPILVREHLSPVGLQEPPAAFISPPKISRSGQVIEATDLIILGAGELLESANNLGSDLSLLTGRIMDDSGGESFVYLDLERDRVVPQRVFTACDIDSLIWITRKPRFIGSVGIYQMPVIRKKAPIWKNNHIMVELLYPQSEEDKEGRRSEWQTKRFRLSRIPHILFGMVGQTTASVDLILFFPRMTHQHPYTGRWENAVPADIQNFFWDRVLLPAWKEIISPVQEPYNTFNRQHMAFKVTRGKEGNVGQPTARHPIHAEELKKLIAAMKYIIEQDPDHLDHFGSFFFVIQVKGSKGLSQKEGETLGASLCGAIERFIESFPALDMDYMQDPANGELVCDVGVTIQPQHECPLVGLWRLDSLEASYGAAGFLAGNIHTVNTLALYGGLQAESPEKRCERTGVVYRQTYNLPWEAVRKIDNSRNLFNEKDVYQQNKTFQQELISVRQVFQTQANTVSYGVRDEFRVSGAAMNEMTRFMDDMVEDFMESRPILWLPSAIWFEFLDRRLGILAETQANLYRLRPSNYGVLSGLLAYLMQSVMFTPPLVNTFVRESLALLQYGRHCDSFGMFFLHTLDLSRDPCLEDILQADSADPGIKRILGELKAPGARFVPPARVEGDETRDIYPLGRNPTWAEIKRSLEANPFDVVSQWELPMDLESYLDAPNSSIEGKACKIFIRFCRGLWVSINPAWLALGEVPEPTTIQEALECWSLDSVVKHTMNVEFRPCNSGRFKGVSGPRTASFGERWKIYFVDEDVVLPTRFEAFGEDSGHIHLYRQTVRPLNMHDTRELNRCLEELLSNCQCLPDGDLAHERNAAIWKVDKHKVIFLVNPDHLRIEGVGTQASGGGRVRRAPRAAAAHRAPKDVQVQMLIRELGYSAEDSERAVRMKAKGVLAREKHKAREEEKRKVARRSKKAKNSRNPPKQRPKKARNSENESGRDEEEEEPEEDAEEEEPEEDEVVEAPEEDEEEEEREGDEVVEEPEEEEEPEEDEGEEEEEQEERLEEEEEEGREDWWE